MDSNGVWYSSLWSELPKNHLNLTILVSKFVPWDLDGCHTADLERRRHWTSRGAARTLRGGAMGRGPMAPPLEDRAAIHAKNV